MSAVPSKPSIQHEVNVMELRLISQARPTSFVIPALAFESEAHALLYCRRLPNSQLKQPLLLVRGRHGKCYVQRPEKRFRYLKHSDILKRDPECFTRPLNLYVEKPDPSIKWKYHVCLFREGKGISSWISNGAYRDVPKWCLPFVRAAKDCYAVWEHAIPGRILASLTVPGGDDTSAIIRVGRKAVGALYSREIVFQKNGDMAGIRTIVAVVCAEIQQSPCPTSTRFLLYRSERYSDAPAHPSEPDLHGIPAVYHELVERARQGYLLKCTPATPELLERHRFLLEQIDRDAKDAEKGEHGYAVHVENTPWNEALAMAKEPWQFAVVSDLHADERFDNGRPHTRRTRILHMIRRSTASEEHKRLLELWLDNYLAQVEDDIDLELA